MTKQEILFILSQCAKDYKKELENRNLLFIYIDKYNSSYALETVFLAKHFKHLTGVVSDLKAKKFYQNILDHSLSERDFDLRDDGTTELKLNVFPFLLTKNLSANMIGDFYGKNTKLYTEKIAGRLYGSMGFIYDKCVKRYVPNTVLHEDLRDIVKSTQRIIATFRKGVNESKYYNLVYKNNKFNWNDSKIKLPYMYKYLSDYLYGNKGKYLEVFPDFKDHKTVERLKGWMDISESSDGMPSFKIENEKTGDIYILFTNYEKCDLRKRELKDNNRFCLIRNGVVFLFSNNLDYIIHEFKIDLKRNDPKGQGCRR